MDKIKVLNQDLINQIAAGEVVERPASVVKELVENSIDAKAENITVEIKHGGINLIKVSDDGSGMSRTDAAYSIKQHATSKINSLDDLYSIDSMGFRGEALASISSVSRFRLITKQREETAGTVVEMLNNEIQLNDIGAQDGTTIEVTDLFYNVPARQKYTKTAVTEFNHVVDLFLNFCLAFPQISWKLIHNDRPVYNFPKSDLKTRISDVLGDDISKNLIEINFRINEMIVQGFIGKPQVARNNKKIQYLFVNNRPVNEYIVAKQVKNAFGTLLPRDLFPIYVLNLSVSKKTVDVNVHPRKLEVRFSEPQLVYKTVYNAVSRTLDQNDLGKQIGGAENSFSSLGSVLKDKVEGTAYQDRLGGTNNQIPNSNFQTTESQISNNQIRGQNNDLKQNSHRTDFSAPYDFPLRSTSFEGQVEGQVGRNDKVGGADCGRNDKGEGNNQILNSNNQLLSQNVGQEVSGEEVTSDVVDFTVLGQLQNSYIIVEVWNGIKIYDQHAVSERLQFEKISRQWQIGKLSSQKLLLPFNIQLAPVEARALSSNMGLLERFGFSIEELSGNTFSVSAVSQFLVNHDIKEVVLDIVGDLTEQLVVEDKISEPLIKIFNMMACRSAIKFGDELSDEGMRALIRDLESLEENRAKYTCVHGRPCVVEFDFDGLKKMFHR